MSRLDRHVAAVQNKLALDRFIGSLAWTSLAFACVVSLVILTDKAFQLRLPRWDIWFFSGIALTVLAAIAYALWRRPSPHAAAVAIDQKLGLKEKISTALYVRPSSDEFAAAAVRDAELTAERVVIDHRRFFPLHFPKPAFATVVVAGLALWSTQIKPLDLFGRAEEHKKQQQQQAAVEEARKTIDRALATVEAIPRAVASDEAIRLAKSDLLNLRNQPIRDPDQARRNAAKALQDVNEAIKQKISGMQELSEAKMAEKMFKQLQQPTGGEGPVADAHKSMVQGQFEQAVQQLDEMLEKFDKMDEQDQEKAAQQMQQLAQALQQMAQDSEVQKQMQKQLEQMMNQQQAQQAQQLMQQAAQGDKQAQQQLQQMAQQMMQQMNNGQGPNQQQQQQLQQMMNQLQAMANNQQVAQQMAQAAQQMAKAMQQAQQQQQQGQQQQGQQQQQAQAGQQMNQAMQNMRQQLQQMQAVANDAQQIRAAQAAGQAAQAQAQNALNGAQGGGQQGDGGQWAQGNIQGDGQQGQWNGQAGFAGPNPGGIGAGDRNYKAPAPYTVKQEISQSQEDEKGKILASTFVKDSKPIRGESKVTLKDVAAAAQAEQTDEVDNERISPQAQRVVREYFGSMERESVPSTQPSR